ncbi:HNH endonuclease [compost metagenome]
MTECKVCRRNRAINDQKQFNLRNPGVKKKYRRKFYLLNKERAFEQVNDWVEKNPEKKRRNQKEWYSRNQKRLSEYRQQRYEHKKHQITNDEWDNCKLYFNYRCACCGIKLEEHFVLRKGKMVWMDFHQDHLYHNGKNDLSNCIPLCHRCNTRKHTSTINQFFDTRNNDYTYEKYHKIYLWIRYEYKKYIKKKRR